MLCDGNHADAGIHTTCTRNGQSLCESCESQFETCWVESTAAWRNPLQYCLGRPRQLCQEQSWTNDTRLRQDWLLGKLRRWGRGLGSYTCWKHEAKAATAAATTAAITAYRMVFQRRLTRLPAIHLWASRHHRRPIWPIRIKQTWQNRRRRTIVRLIASTMGLNRNLPGQTFCRQMVMMQISEPQGKLLPQILLRR